MSKLFKLKVMACVVFTSTLFTPSSAIASGQSIGTLSHIHSVRAFGDQVILGTHEGLFRYIDQKTVQKMSPENFDVMGLAVFGERLFASGHPGPGSKLPEPVGLLISNDRGKTWKKSGLQGEVDFHLLESGGADMYGVDSGSGNLLYSKNAGKSWVSRGKSAFADIAVNPVKVGSALALRNGKLISTQNSFAKSSDVKSSLKISSLDWIKNSLLATSGKSLYKSDNLGKSWKMVSNFPEAVLSVTQSEKIIIVILSTSLYKSVDGGKTFKRI